MVDLILIWKIRVENGAAFRQRGGRLGEYP